MIKSILKENKKLHVILIVEAVLCILCLVWILFPKKTYELSWMDGITQPTAAGQILATDQITLMPGVYQIQMEYQVDSAGTNTCKAQATASYRTFQADTVNLFVGESSVDDTIWVYEPVKDFQMTATYGGTGSMNVGKVTVNETRAGGRMVLFWILLLSILIDVGFICYEKDKRNEISIESKNCFAGLLGIILLASIPVFLNYITVQGDLVFHLSRIEGIADSLRAGIFPARVQPGWVGGQGYAASIFYGDTLLYIPALFRLIGFTMQTSYGMFVFLLNLLTAIISFGCFSKLFENKYIGLFGSLLATCNIYRYFNVYGRGGVGEACAMAFIPLLILGFYRIFMDNPEEKAYKYHWFLSVIGFSGIIQSHTLSCEMAGFMTIVLCLVCIRKVFRRKTFLCLVKVVVGTCLVNAWFLVPFFDYMLSGSYKVTSISMRTIQERGIYLTHLFNDFIQAGISTDYTGQGMINSDPIGIGMGLLLCLIAFIYLLYTGQMTIKKQNLKIYLAGRTAFIMALICLILSLRIYPWDTIQRWGKICDTLISSLQFPWRFLSIGTFCIAVVGCTVALCLVEKENKTLVKVFTGVITACMVITTTYFFGDLFFTRGYWVLYDDDSVGDGAVLGGEYLPTDTNQSLLLHHQYTIGENITLTEENQDALTVTMQVSNTGTNESSVTVPLLLYKGYQAIDTATGEHLSLVAGENHRAQVQIPAGFQGQVVVDFHSPWYWIVAEFISIFTLVGSIWIYHKKGDRTVK